MDRVDVVVIGAGVVGLAIAQRLSGRTSELVVLERHDRFGCDTSSRNSEVIHAGLYYPADTLKARLCVAGNRQLYELCARHGIGHCAIGKYVIANSTRDIEKINHLFEQGTANGVTGLQMVSKEQIQLAEPNVCAKTALFSPCTGIVDSHGLMKFFATSATEKGAIIAYQSTVEAIEKRSVDYVVRFRESDGTLAEIAASTVINAAGLYADSVAAMAGMDIDKCGYRLHPCKGEYFAVANHHRGKLKHLVYPAPTHISLGTHAVLRLDGSMQLGPSAFYVDEISYDVDAGHRDEFYQAAVDHFPFIKPDDLSPYMAGIRPKLQNSQDNFKDFVICEESDSGLPGFINLVGIESPGLTSATAIAEYVDALVEF